ncbi:helix-turn-helix domain-containing protein [Pseudomonas veronii]|uniref:winged helix-turn-helix domain-containing protein n=1 Tax=Pseudomonas TaxID=286 RepID=UPI000CF3086C|nr:MULTISPECIES: helix-turn-helix domain-containing protein [Pseudomonas]UHH32504.1 helix-turn-helix domain-containing protein [Pseudomonas veronii]
MSSLKKHLSTATPVFIPLPDFASNVELLYGDIACPPRTKTAETQTTSTPLFGNQYFNSHYTNNSTIEKPDSANNASTPVIYKTLQPYNKLELNVQLHSTDRPQKALATHTEKPPLQAPDYWTFTQHDRMLVKGGLRISLTTIESALIKKMLHHEERVVSKEELIRNIGREPELYRGLEMCLSRLQEKFKRVNDGERLFRSVRNRGYCLTQRIKNPLELAQQFR